MSTTASKTRVDGRLRRAVIAVHNNEASVDFLLSEIATCIPTTDLGDKLHEHALSEDYDPLQLMQIAFTAKQIDFVNAAEARGMEVRAYSGRFMYGDVCPAVEVDSPTESPYPGAKYDQLGLGYIVYLP